MAVKNVATKDDVRTVVSVTPVAPATSGNWTAGPVSVTAYPSLLVDGQGVIYEARCEFSFKATSPPVTDVDTVVLNASSLGRTHLQGLHDQVLRDGDSITSPKGNTVRIVSSQRLRSE
jgi:hypothetical protein